MSFSPKASQLEALLQSVYAFHLSEQEHLRALHKQWEALSIGGPFSVAFSWRARSSGGVELEGVAGAPAVETALRQLAFDTPSAAMHSMLRMQPMYGLATQRLEHLEGMDRSRDLGFPEFAGLFCPTHTDGAVSVGVPLAPGSVAPAQSPALDAVAAHLASAWRLRRRLESSDAFEHNAEAVFSPDGRLHDAHGPTRRADVRARLRAAVLMRERTLQQNDGSMWPALLAGTHTIVDRFEGNNTRYVVAYRNPVTAVRLVGLTPLERSVVEGVRQGKQMKLIAHEVGLSSARVSNVLRAILRKLGIASAMELTLLASSTRFIALDDDLLGREVVAAFELPGRAADALLELTPAERAVFADLLRGLSNSQIAARRNRSARTISNQVASVLRKLDVPSRRALITSSGKHR